MNGNKKKKWYASGKPNGLVRQYYETGNIMLEANYKNGLLDGLYKTFFANGNLELSCSMIREEDLVI